MKVTLKKNLKFIFLKNKSLSPSFVNAHKHFISFANTTFYLLITSYPFNSLFSIEQQYRKINLKL